MRDELSVVVAVAYRRTRVTIYRHAQVRHGPRVVASEEAGAVSPGRKRWLWCSTRADGGAASCLGKGGSGGLVSPRSGGVCHVILG